MKFITKRLLTLSIAVCALTAAAESPSPIVLSLDSCRSMALRNNKLMRIARENQRKAEYQKKEAFAAYLPAFDFTGGYAYNSRNLSILSGDQMLPTKTFNLEKQQYVDNVVINPMTGKPLTLPDGTPIPSTVAVIPKEALTFDIKNVFFGAITLTQPVFMGGKIVAMNKLTGFAEQLAATLYNREAENIVYAIDGSYWQVVSLARKEELAKSYVALLDTLRNDVVAMINQGVATESDLLQVDVKLNSARVDLVKVTDGVALSRMALNQMAGLPINQPVTLADENPEVFAKNVKTDAPLTSMEDVYDRRADVRALELGIKIRHQQANVAMSSMMPNLVLIGSYEFSNPNMFNGFEKKFAGMFSVGAMLKIPIWHWGGNYNKYRAAQVDENIAVLELEDAKEKIALQVSQAQYRLDESNKTLEMTESNIANADENLRRATIGYNEGVMTLTNVMEAQTGWLKARSENIDAEIDQRLCRVYLDKVLGNLVP
ncbi:MAG: TolC family protein [Muribaculaceae bacterium]|nr:TolC family protein [Muribaculaceae bacterium]